MHRLPEIIAKLRSFGKLVEKRPPLQVDQRTGLIAAIKTNRSGHISAQLRHPLVSRITLKHTPYGEAVMMKLKRRTQKKIIAGGIQEKLTRAGYDCVGSEPAMYIFDGKNPVGVLTTSGSKKNRFIRSIEAPIEHLHIIFSAVLQNKK